MKEICLKPLFVFDMANNHQGDLRHGINIIREVKKACKGFDFNFAFKFQYRHLETFIHPGYLNKGDFKYIKRFIQTKLEEKELLALKEEADSCGFISICTPFDEESVDLIEKFRFKIIKVASSSFTDWPLLERIVKTDKPVIVSTAGASLDDIDKVASFLEHRDKKFALLHCVAEYPVQREQMQMNQLDILRQRYAGIIIGFSSHERPEETEAVKIAVAKGARIFERHVGLNTETVKMNAYSSGPDQVYSWLASAKEAFSICGAAGERNSPTEKELQNLKGLKRGAYAARNISEKEKINKEDLFLAMPLLEDQVSASDLSKYTQFFATKAIERNGPVLFKDTRKIELRDKIYKIIASVKKILKKSNVVVPNKLDFEISYQYGIENFEKFGATIINFVNRDYCKKIIVLLAGQSHPEQFHKQKEETFNILYGQVDLTLNGKEKKLKAGDWTLVEKMTRHSLRSEHGAVIEEISSSYFCEDSFYTDPEIVKNKDRKTYLTYWVE